MCLVHRGDALGLASGISPPCHARVKNLTSPSSFLPNGWVLSRLRCVLEILIPDLTERQVLAWAGISSTASRQYQSSLTLSRLTTYRETP